MVVLIQQTDCSNSFTMFLFIKCSYHMPFKWAILPIHLDKPDPKVQTATNSSAVDISWKRYILEAGTQVAMGEFCIWKELQEIICGRCKSRPFSPYQGLDFPFPHEQKQEIDLIGVQSEVLSLVFFYFCFFTYYILIFVNKILRSSNTTEIFNLS